MKKTAFTLIEIVFVIVIIGILSAVLAPSIKRATLQECADQIASHIRYTQQLALNDNKFNPNVQDWYKTRWQIFFQNANVYNDQHISYTIYSNLNKNTNANSSEIAKNPLNPKQVLSGGTVGASYGTANVTKSMNIGHKYGITNVTFSNNCNNAKRIAFDYLGRPLKSDVRTLTNKYKAGAINRLLQQNCSITISDGTNSKTIVITPETGYVYIQ